MRRFLTAALALVGLAGPSGATTVAYNQVVANQVVTTTTSFTVNMSTSVLDLLAAQVTLSSATPGASTFTDGTQSTGTVTVASYGALAAQASSDTVTITNNSLLAPMAGSVKVIVSSNGTTGILSGSTITVSNVKLYPGTHWTIGASSAATATSLAAAINGYVPNVSASVDSVNGATLTVTCVNAGSFCNSYRVTTSTVAITFSTAGLSNLLTGGTDNAVVTVNGYAFRQGESWSKQDVSSNTAISLMNAVDALSAYVASTNTATSVLIQCATAGSYCNSTTLTVSGSGLSALSPAFSAGQDNAFLNINGTILTQGTDFTASASSASTANSIAAAINSNAALSAVMVATAPLSCTVGACGVVQATGTVSLSSNNYYWRSSTQTALTVLNSGLFGGTTAGYLINTASISAPSHGLATGAGVKFTSGTVAIGGLTNQTTYFVIAVDANTLQLAKTSTGAFAGAYITLTSSSTTGPHTFTLTPLALSGTMTLTWQASQDGSNWANMNVSAATFSTPYATASTLWDLGSVDFKYVRAQLSGPDAGGVNVLLRATGKRYGSGL